MQLLFRAKLSSRAKLQSPLNPKYLYKECPELRQKRSVTISHQLRGERPRMSLGESQVTALTRLTALSCGLWQQKPCDSDSIQPLRPSVGLQRDHPVYVLPSLIKSYAARTNQNIASQSCVVRKN